MLLQGLSEHPERKRPGTQDKPEVSDAVTGCISVLEYKLNVESVSEQEKKVNLPAGAATLSPEVGKRYAEPSKRKERGLYRDEAKTYNARCRGHIISGKYHSVSG